MGDFHRLTTPSYFTDGGEFPPDPDATYDYINNATTGTPALAGVVKAGGPNEGTYFIAFGEDGTSEYSNRANKALAQNCDYLDDLFHRSLAVPTRTADLLVGSPVSSVTLPIGTYLGPSGTANNATSLNLLFEITDLNDNELLDNTTATKCKVNTVTLSGGDTLGSDDFSENTVQLNISPSIPASVSFRVYYATRTNLATLPTDALSFMNIRGANETADEVEIILKALQGSTLAWNTNPPTSNVYDLARAGLDERYRRSTTSATTAPETNLVTAALDTAGAGFWIKRDGPALSIYSIDAAAYTDPMQALLRLVMQDSSNGGSQGALVYGARAGGSAVTGEYSDTWKAGHMLLGALWQHAPGATYHASNPYTRIEAGAACSLANVGTYNANTGEAVVTLTDAANYFRKSGTLDSSIALGYDLIELQFTQSAVVKVRTYVMVGMGATGDTTNIRKVKIRNLDGSVPDFDSAAASSATVRKWYSTTFAVGDGAGRRHQQEHSYSDAISIKLDGLHYAVPPDLSSSAGDNNVVRTPVSFVAQKENAANLALRWGFFDKALHGPDFSDGWGLAGDGKVIMKYFSSSTSSEIIAGDLTLNDGKFVATSATVALFITGESRFVGPVLVEGDVRATALNVDIQSAGTVPALTISSIPDVITIDVRDGGTIFLQTASNSTGTLGLNFTNVAEGDIYTLIFEHTGTGTILLLWQAGGVGSRHYFSGGEADDGQPTPGAATDVWTGVAKSTTQIIWTITRNVDN